MLTKSLVLTAIAFRGDFFTVLAVVKRTGVSVVTLCIVLAAYNLFACEQIGIEVVFAFACFTEVGIAKVFSATVLIVAQRLFVMDTFSFHTKVY